MAFRPPWAPAIGPALPVSLDRPLVQGGLAIGQAQAFVSRIFLGSQNVPIAADGTFLLGAGRDAAATLRLDLELAGGGRDFVEFAVAPRAFEIERISGLPPKTVTLPPELLERRAREVEAIRAARAGLSDLPGWRGPFLWPARGRISGIYGSQRIRNGVPGSPHSGVDVANAIGTPVAAPAAGIIRLAEPDFLLEGGLIILDHGLGLYSQFLHLSRLDVKAGDAVVAGQRIGAIGMTGRSTGPHLHWGMVWFDARIDPQLLTGPFDGPVRGPAPLVMAGQASQPDPELKGHAPEASQAD